MKPNRYNQRVSLKTYPALRIKSIYDVLFSVGQQITENESKKNITSTYTVTDYVDEAGNMVIIKNPTINSKVNHKRQAMNL